jgi:ATP-dependent RNA helicase HelY
LAALATALVFEQRRDDDDEYPRLPKGNFRDLLVTSEEVLDEINVSLKRHRLKQISPLDPSASYAMHRWTNGGSLDSVLYEGGFLIGDFIRLCKQVIDMLEQIGRASEGNLAVSAAKAIDQVKRGIVAYSYYA